MALLKDLIPLVEMTLPELEQSTTSAFPDTKARLNAAGQMTIVDLDVTADESTNVVRLMARVRGSTDTYSPTIVFKDVEVDTEPFTGAIELSDESNSKSLYIERMAPHDHDVAVSCTCKDFVWRFSRQNADKQALNGTPPQLDSKGLRPSVNPMNAPGICKHIRALGDHAQKIGLTT